MGIFDELFESHRKYGKRHHHDHHTYRHDGRRHGSREAWPYHASHSHDSGDRHGARYLPS